jgi:hypothetical protein
MKLLGFVNCVGSLKGSGRERESHLMCVISVICIYIVNRKYNNMTTIRVINTGTARDQNLHQSKMQ